MPFALDYDGYGNVIGGHFVEELRENPLLVAPYHGLLPNPLYGHDTPSSGPLHATYRQPRYTRLHQPTQSPPMVHTKGDAFLQSFTRHFATDAHTMVAFEALFTDYNNRVTDETEFYTGMFMLLSRTQSLHLLPELKEVLPASWQAEDLTWLHRAAEAWDEGEAGAKRDSHVVDERISSNTLGGIASDMMGRRSSEMVEHVSSHTIEQVLPLAGDTESPISRTKKPPTNGFRTSHACATTGAPLMYVDPAALMIHQPVLDTMPDSDEDSDTSTPMTDEMPSITCIVKLKLNPKDAKRIFATPRQSSPKKPAKRTKARGSLLKESITVDEDTDEPTTPVKKGETTKDNAASETKSQATLARKGRNRYGDMYSHQLEHFGHFPTRRAVIARTSRPYVHLSCGKGFSHPMDVKDHHRNKDRTNSGAGCPGKDGVPQGDDDEWDAHPSARVEYPDLNYTKVRDGYVLLNQESRDKIDNAIAAGLEYLAEREAYEQANGSDADAEHEMDEDA